MIYFSKLTTATDVSYECYGELSVYRDMRNLNVWLAGKVNLTRRHDYKSLEIGQILQYEDADRSRGPVNMKVTSIYVDELSAEIGLESAHRD